MPKRAWPLRNSPPGCVIFLLMKKGDGMNKKSIIIMVLLFSWIGLSTVARAETIAERNLKSTFGSSVIYQNQGPQFMPTGLVQNQGPQFMPTSTVENQPPQFMPVGTVQNQGPQFIPVNWRYNQPPQF